MPSKVQLYAQMADRTAEQITGSYQKWTAFLTTAARLYKYPYNEQLMIFAQRPEATACAEYDLWNKQMRRYVRRGGKGIALVDTSSDQPKLRYVFDVSDTSGGENSRRPYLWEYRQEHREVVSAALEQRFDVSGENGLADQMERVAAQLVDEYWHDNRRDIVGIVDGSFLEDYDEFNIGAAFRNAAVVSTTYALLSRCGMQPRDYFEHEDFLNVFDFNTPQTVAALGTAISQSSELVLRQIEVTIKNYEREKIAERSESHERTDLHPQRGLSDSRPEPDRAAASPAGQVRQDAEGLPEGASSGAVEQPAAVREAVPPSAGDRRGSEQPTGTDDAGADEVSGRDGSAESQRPDEVGRADEHAESAGRGNDPHGTGVQLNMFDAPAGAQMSFFPSEAEQIQSIAEAESVTPSAFSMFISQDDIDHILRTGGNADAARMKIAAEFSKQKPLEDRAAFLKALYYGGNGLITDNGRLSAWYGDDGIHIATGDTSRYLRSAQVIGWEDAAERIEELLDGGAFATNLEVTEAPRYERLGIAVDVWNLYHDFSDEAKSLGYLSCLGNIHSTSFPEETERLTDDLLNPAFRERLLSEYKVFMDAYRENRALLRFHYHKSQTLLTRLEDLSLPRKEFRSDMAAIPATGRFITEDEIAVSLANGSSFEGGKTRIYAFFQTSHTPKENADFLKKEYGIGGHTHAVSRESGSYEDHGSKGITLKKAGCADVQMNWNKVASRISELIRMNRYFTPDEQALYDKAQAQDVVRNTAYDSYNVIKEAHPDNIVLFQVGDFFELYGEDAKQAAELLDMNLTTRNIPGAGRVEMCGVPSHNLEMYVEKLRDKYDVTIAEAPDFRGEHHIYTLRSIDHEAEAAINAYEAEFGADGTRVFRDPTADAPQPTVQDRLEHYRPVVIAAVLEDTAYRNACGHSDRENAEIECNAAVRRAILGSKDMELIRLFSDVPEFRNHLHQEVFEETYARLHDLLRPLSQDDIDDALRAWNGNIESKHAVVRYMEQHGREKETAAWLAHEYGGNANNNLFIVRAGSPETVELTWPKVQRRIAQLIKADKFYTEAERDSFDDIDPIAIREALAERGIVGGKVVDPEKLNNDPFIQQVMADTDRIYAEENFVPGETVFTRDGHSYLIDRVDYTTGTVLFQNTDFIPPAGEDLFQSAPISEVRRHLEMEEETQPVKQAEPTPTADAKPSYDVGDTLYLDGKPFEITEVGLFDVHLRNPSQAYPIFRVESKERLPALLRQDERNAHLFTPDAPAQEQPVTKPVAFYPAEKTHLPYDIEIQTLHIPEPEHDPPTAEPAEPEPPAMSEEEALILEQEGRAALSEMGEFVPDFDDAISQAEIDEPPAHRPVVSIPVDGEWQGFPSIAAAEQAAYADFKAASHRDAQNFHITDDALGVGGAKAKFRANMAAIHLLQELEFEGLQASPEQQEILSRYVGWGGLADAFDENKPNWSDEFAELYATLSPEEYAAARASTLNAHYTSPTVIKAIYEAVGNMGFQTGNILEPSMGVGNFFGLLPEQMQGSKLYGVELDSITGRIAKQLYPKADITIAGFETTDRKDFYDLAVGNVPFGQYQVDDRAYNKLGFSIHDYFFAKTLDQVRPGGVIAFVTSRYTMDKQSPEVRRYIAQRAELLGAIRLPNNAFRANAGTDVVSDILFLQKRDRPIEIEPDWVHLSQNRDGFAINRYFVDHPEMILGRQTSESTQYGKQDFTVVPIEGLALADQLHDAVKNIRGTYQEAELPELGEGEQIDTSIPADPNVKNYSYTMVDGEVYYRENSRMVKPELNATAAERVKGMVALRDCVNELIALQMDEYSAESRIQEAQTELNRLYDAFSAKHGLINDRANRLAFSDDSSYYLLCSLEVLDDDGKLERKADMFHKRTIKQQRSVDSVDTASEALAVCIGEKACVDLDFMASLMGGSEKIPQIVEDLKGVIYKEPNSGPFDLQDGGEHWAKGWQTADEYLSGNVRQKLRTAQRVAARDPFFAGNVDALIAAQPKDLEASEIEVRLGATWLDKKYIEQFMYETFETPRYLRGQIEISYVPYTAEWQVSRKSMVRYNDVAAFTTYGTDRASAYRLLEDALNLRDIRIYDTIEDADGRERRVLNAKETTLAAQKQQLIRDAFKDWIWKDPERRETLVRQYNEEMNSTRPREYDGSHIVFSGMNPEITLREHQKNAIAHVLYGGNTLLAHEVGAGKTFEMVASAMESKRLGLCQKSIFVVPNHLTEQWASEFLRLYPSANILVTTKKDFETHNRKKFCARIATGDYDAVIIGHSQFERIPISPERQEQLLHQQIEEITDGIQDTKLAGGNSFTIKSLERTKKGLEARLKKLQASDRKDGVIYFEQLGVDRMFVDESDNYKNLFLYTKMRNVAGLSTTDAQKSSDMFSKCRYMDELTGGRGVVFATGTPVSNSMTELYTIQRYLQHDRLQEMGMGHFDCWASRFGETTTALELAPEGTGYRARTRFAKFFNLPELMNLFKEVADIKTADQLHLPTPEVAYHTIATKPTQIQQDMVKALSERASKVHSGAVSPDVDNMLKITSDGRKLGLDQRIINPMLPDEETTKVNQCVANILQYWRDGEEEKLTQLVFCDISTPKATPSQRAAKASPGTLDSPEIHALESAISLEESAETPFTVYEDVRQKLIDAGMPPEQIAFIHDANTEVKKRELFAKVRSGQVRVLMGSTAKMGAGTNVQDRLVALHDLDCPWRPRDLTQRKGRIERQGNQNKLVHVCRYVTEGTFDAYLWQTVENKQKFISQIMTSKSPVRSCEDVDATALSFAEIKALCAGDPRIKERMDLDIEVSKLKIMKADHNSKQFRLEDSLLKYFPEKIEEHKGFVRGLEADMQTLAAHPLPAEGFVGMEIRGDRLTDKENAGAALLDTCKEVKGKDPVQIGSYRGFTMSVAFDSMWKMYTLTLKGQMTHRVELGSDARGNLVRIENALDKMPERLRSVQEQLENLYNQQAAAKAEVGKPFPQEQELAAKTARLIELDMELNLDGKGQPQPEQAIAKSTRPSVLDRLKAPPVHGAPEKPHKKEMEAR